MKKECLCANSVERGIILLFQHVATFYRVVAFCLLFNCPPISQLDLALVLGCEDYRTRAVPATYTRAWQTKMMHCGRDDLRVERGRNERP